MAGLPEQPVRAGSYRAAVPATSDLPPAARDDLTRPQSGALDFSGRKLGLSTNGVTARATTERLVEQRERLGHAVMRKPPLGQDRKLGIACGVAPASRPRRRIEPER